MSLNIPDYNLFFTWKLQPPWKRQPPLFPSNPPLKVEVLSSLPFWEFGWRLNPLSPAESGGGGGAHDVQPFTHDMVSWYYTQNTTHINIMYFYRANSVSTSLGKGEGERNKKWHRKEGVQSKKWCPSHKFSYIHFSVTDNLTANNKKSTSKKDATIVSEITIQYLHKNIIILLLCQCGLNFLKFQLKWKIVKYFARLKQRAALRKLFSLSPSHSH